MARAEGVSLSEWVSRVLRAAVTQANGPTPESRMKAVDRALSCNHPTADVHWLLADIERGRDLR